MGSTRAAIQRRRDASTVGERGAVCQYCRSWVDVVGMGLLVRVGSGGGKRGVHRYISGRRGGQRVWD